MWPLAVVDDDEGGRGELGDDVYCDVGGWARPRGCPNAEQIPTDLRPESLLDAVGTFARSTFGWSKGDILTHPITFSYIESCLGIFSQ